MGTHLHLQVSTGRGMSGEGVPFTLRDTRTGSAASPADSLRGMPTTGTVLWFP